MNTTTKINPFEPITLRGLKLKNRIVMAPMTRSRALGGLPNELMADYYAQRASAGLIITEGVSPSPSGLGYARIPGIFNEGQINGWKKITDSVHEKEGKIFVQLMHTGRISHSANMPDGAKVIAPSSVKAEGSIWTDTLGMAPYPVPESMTSEEIKETVNEFLQGAQNAIAAGFDGVELHGANGYLLEQFLNPHVNTRKDMYGGSIYNRIRFVLEVVDAVIHAIGKNKVGIRLSPFNVFNSTPEYTETVATYEGLINELNMREILYIHVIESSARKHAEGAQLLANIRDRFNGTLIVNGAYSKATIEDALETNRADLVSLGVPFISNPDLINRLEHNISLNAPDSDTFYSADEKGYTDYPFYEQR